MVEYTLKKFHSRMEVIPQLSLEAVYTTTLTHENLHLSVPRTMGDAVAQQSGQSQPVLDQQCWHLTHHHPINE